MVLALKDPGFVSAQSSACCYEPMGWELPEEVWGPHQGQVPGMHVGLAAE